MGKSKFLSSSTPKIITNQGVTPFMTISTDVGTEAQKPLATVIAGGVCFSSFLTLFVIPALYQWFPKTLKDAGH